MLFKSVFSLLSGLFLVSSVAVRDESRSSMNPDNTTSSTVPINAAQSFLDVDSYPDPPIDLELQQVHVYFRHGARVPVSICMSGPPASIPEHWLMCKTGRKFDAPVTSFRENELDYVNDGASLPIRKVLELRNGTAVEGLCQQGELTDVGRQSTYSYGTALRTIYIERLGFLPDVLTNNSEVYFRSTNMGRTMDSLYQVIHGLYPAQKLGTGTTPRFLVRNAKDENLVGNMLNCKRLEILLLRFASEAAAAFEKPLKRLDTRISKYIGGRSVRLDRNPGAFGILDTVRACQAHNVKIPPELEDKEVIDLIEKAVVEEWFGGCMHKKSEEVQRLGVGRLFSDLSQRLAHKAQHGEADPLKFLVHSTHDTGIAPIASSLGVYDDRWPAFASTITFELFSRKQVGEDRKPQSFLQFVGGAVNPFRMSTSREHYVRMRYQNKDMHLPACAKEGDHLPGRPEFCTYAAFQARMMELVPEDWEAECRTTEQAPSDSTRHW